MESIKMHSHVGADGMLTIQMPPNLKEKDVEVVLVVQALESEQQFAFKTDDSAKKKKNIPNY
jgi:trans-aconitate methyltransferase